jgi:hypothetical protein
MQDMTDNEAIGAINARDRIRKEMGLPPIPHILVTNPRRRIEVSLSGKGNEGVQTRTVGELIKDKYPDVELVDPDEFVLDELAKLAKEQDLPLEILTNPERSKDYDRNLVEAIESYNENRKPERPLRLASPEDGKRTLTIVNGSTDEDTIAQIHTYGDEYSRNGMLVAIINDPEKVGRLPYGVKYVCVGSIVAEAVLDRYKKVTQPKPAGYNHE